MSDDLQRRVKQLEMMVASLMRQLEGQRNQRQPATGLIQPVLAIPGSDIPAKAEDGSEFDVTFGSAVMYDISPINGSNIGRMKSAGRSVKIGNPYDSAITAGSLTICVPYKQNYLPVAEQCDVE